MSLKEKLLILAVGAALFCLSGLLLAAGLRLPWWRGLALVGATVMLLWGWRGMAE